MLLMPSVLLAVLLILCGAAAVVQHNKLRESRRRQARSLLLALAVSETYGQYAAVRGDQLRSLAPRVGSV